MNIGAGAVVAIWNDIREASRADFYEWHNREHMPERVAIAGFRRGRRYIALEGAPEYFTLYDTDGPHVVAGSEYLARLNAPTSWTRRVTQHFFNVSRSLCRVDFTTGIAEGGHLMTWRYDVLPGREGEHHAWLLSVLPGLMDCAGIVAVHLCLADRAASEIPTAEKTTRSEQNLVPAWIVMVEGGAEGESLRACCKQTLPDAMFYGSGAAQPVQRGLYRLQYSRSKS
ncbi:MAG: hypothetical protein M3Z31_13935 [Pseudomonadota bacterium]|nr:hypothetical protein [Pseudomonadota bacterium]